MQKQKTIKSSLRQRNIAWSIMSLFAVVHLIVFKYIPMVGIIIAFKQYRFSDGIFGSAWVGFDNFTAFLRSREIGFLFRNTIGYNILFDAVGIPATILVALLLYELKSRTATKVYQTIMIVPRFISIIILGYITYSFLNPVSGLLNTGLEAVGLPTVDCYATKWVWPFIFTVVAVWRSVGMSSILYYAAFMGLDNSIIEAAEIDGAKKWQKYVFVLVPCIMPTIVILLILNIGSILDGDFGLFYYIPRNVGALRPVTEIFSTYTMRLFKGQDVGVNYSLSAAISFFQSIAGMILVLLANKLATTVDKELGLF